MVRPEFTQSDVWLVGVQYTGASGLSPGHTKSEWFPLFEVVGVGSVFSALVF